MGAPAVARKQRLSVRIVGNPAVIRARMRELGRGYSDPRVLEGIERFDRMTEREQRRYENWELRSGALYLQRNAFTSGAATALRPVRSRHSNRQPRARAAKRSPGKAASGSRDGPHLGDDDPPPLAPDFRPSQGATAVARAFESAVAARAA
jgi:hypothetical protein